MSDNLIWQQCFLKFKLSSCHHVNCKEVISPIKVGDAIMYIFWNLYIKYNANFLWDCLILKSLNKTDKKGNKIQNFKIKIEINFIIEM